MRSCSRASNATAAPLGGDAVELPAVGDRTAAASSVASKNEPCAPGGGDDDEDRSPCTATPRSASADEECRSRSIAALRSSSAELARADAAAASPDTGATGGGENTGAATASTADAIAARTERAGGESSVSAGDAGAGDDTVGDSGGPSERGDKESRIARRARDVKVDIALRSLRINRMSTAVGKTGKLPNRTFFLKTGSG